MHHIAAPSYKKASNALDNYQWHAIHENYSYLGKKKNVINKEKDILTKKP